MGHETGMDERLLAEAARWHARLAAENCTDFDRAQFQRWRAASRRHADAYESAAGFSRRLEHLAELDETLRSMADEAFAQSPRTRRWMVPATLAASIVVALVGVRIGGY